MIVDLGEGGLVRPWASVNIEGVAKINPAPEGLGPNWKKIHDGLANLMLTALETLPRQLLQVSGLQTGYSNVSVQDGWITQDLDE